MPLGAAEAADPLGMSERLPPAEKALLSSLSAADAWNRIATTRTPPRRDESGRVLAPRPGEFTEAQRLRLPGDVSLQVRAAAPGVRLTLAKAAIENLASQFGEALSQRTAARRNSGKPILVVVAPFELELPEGAVPADRPLLQQLQRVGEAMGTASSWNAAFTVTASTESRVEEIVRKLGGGTGEWTVSRGFLGLATPKVRWGPNTYAAEDVFILVGTATEESADFCTLRLRMAWRLFQPRRQPATAILTGETDAVRALHPTRGWIDPSAEAMGAKN